MSANDALDHDHSGLLSDATMAAMQLHQQPFASSLLNAKAMDPGSEDGEDLGEKGAGKTTLLQQLNTQSGLRIQCFTVTGSERFSTLNLFSGMLEAFKISPPEKLKDVLDELIPCLQSMIARNTLSAIVLDDADKASNTELTQLLIWTIGWDWQALLRSFLLLNAIWQVWLITVAACRQNCIHSQRMYSMKSMAGWNSAHPLSCCARKVQVFCKLGWASWLWVR